MLNVKRIGTGGVAIGFCVFLLTGVEAEGKSLRHRAKTSKASAPTVEDHADYFSSNSDGVSPARKKRADALRLKTIRSIQQLVKGKKMKSHRKFELYLRMGELHAERADYLREVEVNRFVKEHDAWNKTKKGREPAISHKGSRNELLKSVRAFRNLVRRYPRHPRTDAALFALAKTLGRLNNDNAVLYFNQLIRKHPRSQYIPDAHLALGEFYFDRRNVKGAMASYKAAMKYKKSKAYPYAVYKLGWAYYNSPSKSDKDHRKNLRKALAAFKLVVKLSDREKARPGRLNLRKEAIRDLVMVWAETGSINDAWVYFRRLGEKDAFYDMLERLGNIYVDQGENKKALLTFNRLLKESPDRAKNPAIHVQVIELHDLARQPASVVSNLTAMQQLYAGKSSWTRKHAKDKTLILEARERTRKNIHRWGALYHQKGQKRKDNNLQAAAAKIYKLYLVSWPGNKESYQIRYYLADIYFHFKQYEAASDEYLKVARQDPKGKFRKDSALNAVVAINALDEKTKYPKLPERGKVAKARPLPRVKVKLIQVIDAYVQMLPKEKAGHAMRYTAADTYYRYGHYKQAMQRFEKIALELPGTKQGKNAVGTILSYYENKKQWPELIARCRKLLKSKTLVASGLYKPVYNTLKSGVFRLAQRYEKEKKVTKAAALYVAYQKEFSKDKNADRALYNASLNYYKAANVDAALKAGQALIKAYPKSSLLDETIINMGQTFESLASFEQAAAYYKKFGLSFPKDKRAPNALFNAATLYRGVGQAAVAASLYDRFTSRYPQDPKVGEAEFEMARMKEKQRDYPGAVNAWSRVARRSRADRSLFAEAKVAELNLLYVNRGKGRQLLSRLAGRLAKTNDIPAFEARSIVAGIMFRLLEPRVVAFKNMRITSPTRLEQDVRSKQSGLLNLAKEFEKVIAVGSGEYAVASMVRMGEMHENFSKDLFNAPAPAGADQVALDQFRSSIEKVAFPLKEEAYKYYKGAYERSGEVQTFTVWTKRAYTKMAELSPEKHPVVMEKAADPKYMAHSMQWEGAVSGLAD